MSAHVCAEDRTCCCSLTALEPSEDCPVHGHPWPPRCGDCGRLMKWPAVPDVKLPYIIDRGPAV